MAANEGAPIIIKKVKKGGGDGHHGGAWKVAYADFVTAMMAFFLLMWLLNATTESQRKGIADYFNPSIPLSRVSGGGDGSFGGESVFSENTLAQNGSGAADKKPTEQKAAKGDLGTALAQENKDKNQDASISSVEADLLGRTGESMVSDLARRHVLTRQTDKGLVVEFFDIEGEPLFDDLTNQPTKTMMALVEMLGPILDEVTNPIALDAHVRVQAENSSDTVWNKSIKRAQNLQKILLKSGVADKRFARVSGHGDRKRVAANPVAIRNNRIEVTLLRSDL